MKKYICSLCHEELEESHFYFRHHTKCINCWNRERRENNKKAICRHCKAEFRPGVQGRYRYCSHQCRFMDKVDKTAEPPCWIWTGHISERGYGTFVPIDGGKSALAHREAYRLFKGAIDKKCVMHICDNPKCVNPDHLRLVSDLDNVQDCIKKGRLNTNKLSDVAVHDIRELYSEGAEINTLAKIYKRSLGTIIDIVHHRSWKEIK